ncbi:hypothetical protein JG688_00010654 [Phytophthora aleatoria]|uniref:GAF domain-containing protein n=1 Tax=Phytophthora aleatoria TaxID=2496075 RepID=A0A8J5IVV3_9STRA|nr:hypothetical protein JG688_00010654 [Phytophthora aleatoria]
MADAEALHDRLDFATFIDIAESPQLPLFRDGQPQWKRVERSSTFTLLKRENEVLALARLDASVEEVAKILGPTTDQMHVATMKGIYGDSFISGSVAYVQRPRPYEDEQAYQQLSVKTSNFVHSDMLGKNEQCCSSSEKMETHNGRLVSIIVCSRCRKSVTACDYDHMMTVISGPEQVLPDTPQHEMCLLSPTSSITSESSGCSFASSDSSSSQMLSDLLDQVVDDDEDSGRRHAAFKVLNQLITANQADTQIQVDKNATLLRKASASPRSLKVAKQALDVSECPKDLKACKFASAESRPYPMMPAVIKNDEEESKEDDPLIYPIPSNEEVRMAAIEHLRLHEVVNIPELNVICTLAAAEMNCPHSVLTLVERDVVTLMATNDPENWDLGSGNPREQTFCQHFVMDDKPLLVRHAEADMRFYHIAPVTMRSLRFYAGFPVSVPCVSKTPGQPDRVVVGALCCLDAKPHQMTRSQYWRLMKLADAASSILERTAKEFVADPKNHPLGQNNSVGVQPPASRNGIAAVAC